MLSQFLLVGFSLLVISRPGTSVGDVQDDLSWWLLDQSLLQTTEVVQTMGLMLMQVVIVSSSQLPPNGGMDIGIGEIQSLAYDIAQSVANVSNHTRKNQLLEEMIRLNECRSTQCRICWTINCPNITAPHQESSCCRLCENKRRSSSYRRII
jgi:hypothetical protein